MTDITITLNGDPQTVAADATVTTVVALLGHDPTRPGVAVALDGEVVRRVDWGTTTVTAGTRVEVLTAVQGGA